MNVRILYIHNDIISDYSVADLQGVPDTEIFKFRQL